MNTESLTNAMREAGFMPSDPRLIVPDGRLRRFHVSGDSRQSRNGWAVLHTDHGAAGHWKTGARVTWTANTTRELTREQRAAIAQQIAAERFKAEAEQAERHGTAANRARTIWENLPPANPDHPYLALKRIRPGVARQQGDALVLPITDAPGTLHGLQFIDADGNKLMLKDCAKRGNFIIATGTLDAAHILIGEGFATIMSAVELIPAGCAVAAIDAGNMLPVARAIRVAHLDAAITIAADDDRLTVGNPGLTAARAAAAAIGARLARPTWPPGSPIELSDFNDLARWLVGGGR